MTFNDSIRLLKDIISIPSFSKEEAKVADFLCEFLETREAQVQRLGNNLWLKNEDFNSNKPTLLLNSHIDTVKPNSGWIRDPFVPQEEDSKIYGLGSNDAGASLVSLIHSFFHFYNKILNINLLLACTAEEEISGANGISLILDHLGNVDFGIVGEPTQMKVAIAEKGLLVVDCIARGKSGHAARNEGLNAIQIAIEDISWLHQQPLTKISKWLGPCKLTVTKIEAGTQHNVVPAECKFVIDIRLNECYQHEDVLSILSEHLQSEIHPRSLRLKSSGIDTDHPLVKAAEGLGLHLYGSPTLSDQALIPFPTIKMGCGNSGRSHTADEFVYVSEIEKGINGYIQFIEKFNQIIAS